jgi:hypothetical protein
MLYLRAVIDPGHGARLIPFVYLSHIGQVIAFDRLCGKSIPSGLTIHSS